MAKEKKYIIILLPVVVTLLYRLVHEIFSFDLDSLLTIGILFLIGLVVHLIYPVIIYKYLKDIPYSKVVAIMLILFIFCLSLIDLSIMTEIRYAQDPFVYNEGFVRIVIESLMPLVTLTQEIGVLTGIVGLVVAVRFENKLAKYILMSFSIYLIADRALELLDVLNIVNYDLKRTLYSGIYWVRPFVGSIVIYLGLKELKEI